MRDTVIEKEREGEREGDIDAVRERKTDRVCERE